MECSDLTGEKFGKWLVIERCENTPSGASQWVCVCECGKTERILGSNLRCKRTKSCKKCASKRSSEGHPVSKTKIYKVWLNMKSRCFYEKDSAFKNYGNRGITVCKEWKDSFESFYEYVSKLPHFNEEGYSLDRINNDGNYEPGNVRWATFYEQTHNRRK